MGPRATRGSACCHSNPVSFRPQPNAPIQTQDDDAEAAQEEEELRSLAPSASEAGMLHSSTATVATGSGSAAPGGGDKASGSRRVNRLPWCICRWDPFIIYSWLTSFFFTLPHKTQPPAPPLLKRDLLRRKFDDEVVEPWVKCGGCKRWMHQVCALYNAQSPLLLLPGATPQAPALGVPPPPPPPPPPTPTAAAAAPSSSASASSASQQPPTPRTRHQAAVLAAQAAAASAAAEGPQHSPSPFVVSAGGPAAGVGGGGTTRFFCPQVMTEARKGMGWIRCWTVRSSGDKTLTTHRIHNHAPTNSASWRVWRGRAQCGSSRRASRPPRSAPRPPGV